MTWSLNPPEVASQYESNVPTVDERIEAMSKASQAGYPVRGVLMPVIPVEGWEKAYTRFVKNLLDRVPLQRLTIGGVCSYKNARALMEQKLGSTNTISKEMSRAQETPDGRMRYSKKLRFEMYKCILDTVGHRQPHLDTALCLEEHDAWQSNGLEKNIGMCNCVL